MAMTEQEKETIIRFDKESDKATVYTHELRIINRLKRDMKRLKEEGGKLVREDKFEGTPSATFIVPVKWIKVTPPKKVESRKGRPVGKPLKEGRI